MQSFSGCGQHCACAETQCAGKVSGETTKVFSPTSGGVQKNSLFIKTFFFSLFASEVELQLQARETLTSVLLDQLCTTSTPYARKRMTDERLEVSPSPVNMFPSMLECQTGFLLQSEQTKLSEATYKLDKLSQELQSMWSTQQEVETDEKIHLSTRPTASNTYGSSKSESQSNYDELLPIVSVTRSQSPQLSQTYTPLLPPHQPPPPYSFNPMTLPMLYSQQEQCTQSDRAPSPRPMMPGPQMLYSQQEQRTQSDRAPSPRPMMPGPQMLYSQQEQRTESDRAPSPRPMMPGSPMLYSQQEQRTQSDRAPSPRPMMPGPQMLYSQQEQRTESDRAPSPRPMMPGPQMLYSQQEQRTESDRAPSPRPMMPGPQMLYSQQEQRTQSDRAPSPRPMMPGSPMLYSQQEQRTQSDRAPSPRPMMPGSPMLYSQQEQRTQSDRAPSRRAGFNPMTQLEKPVTSLHPLMYPVHEHQSSPSGTLERSSPHHPGVYGQSPSTYPRACYSTDPFTRINPHENVHEAEDGSLGGRQKASFTPDPGSHYINTDQELNWNAAKRGGSWRQTDLDLAVLPNKAAGGHSIAYDSIQIYGTLPKSIGLPPRRHEAAHPQQQKKRSSILPSPQASWPNLPSPILARCSIPPAGPRASPIKERRNVLPLSVLMRPAIINSRRRLPAHARLLPIHPPAPTVRRYPQPQHAQDVGRKVPDFPPSPSDAKHSPLPLAETGEVEPEIASILQPSDAADLENPENVPRPLSPTRLQPVSLPDTEAIQDMEELLRIRAAIPRALKKRTSIDQAPEQYPPVQKRTRMYQQLTKLFTRSSQKMQQELSEGPALVPASPQISPASDSDLTPTLPTPFLESPTSPPTLPVKRSILKQDGWSGASKKTRARLNPLVVLLDAALLGELDVVKQVVYEMNDPSQSNDEGITGLHNAVCGGHYDIVEFLVNFGVNINAPDSYGWTPLHCAASCNDLAICTFLVKKGAAIFSMTLCDGDTAAEKCDRYLDDYEECARFLFSAEQQAGMMNSAVVYALWDYEAENSDELTFHEGDTITILQRGDKEESNWWWASLFGREGYIPYNFLGLFPRVRPVV
ncbi:relA-associated inhibitor isoform X2 [Heterodontus francisci]|uniref:relA-associated inhibitor isoform X2 n=1 Tax=Heterodontus francisci TaxID=7792 RepID=UPI00355BC2C3